MDKASGRVVVRVNPAFYRVNDVRPFICLLPVFITQPPSFAFASVGLLVLENESTCGV